MEIISVLEMNLDNDTLVRKHDKEDFNCKTQLIVQQSQEAIFYYSGQAQDVFKPDRYTLDTANIPILSGLLKRVTGDISPFHATVYFINTAEIPNIKWGTPDTFTVTQSLMEGEAPTPFQVAARGNMSVKVNNSRKLIEKLVGTESELLVDDFIDKIFPIAVAGIKEALSKTMSNLDLITIDQNLLQLSDTAMPFINEQLEDYGVELCKFVVDNIKKPEDSAAYQSLIAIRNTAVDRSKIQADTRKQNDLEDLEDVKFLRAKKREVMGAQADAEITATLAGGEAAARSVQGYTYQQEMGFKVAQAAAGNQGIGEFTNAGVGIGMMTGIGGTIGAQVNSAVTNSMGTVNFGQVGGQPGMQANMAAMNGQPNVQAGMQANMAAMNGQPNAQAGMQAMNGQPNAQAGMQTMNGQPNAQAGMHTMNGQPNVQAGMQTMNGQPAMQPMGAQQSEAKMIFCPECGNQIPKGKFCMNCGHRFEEEKPVCKGCGKDLIPGAKFCMECGTPV